MEWWLAYLAIGLIAGFLAGLLGIGGGAVMVPMLVFVFTAQRLPAEHLLHLALGTAMATIVFTSVSSMRAHHAHGAVDWRIARAMAPGMLVGSFCRGAPRRNHPDATARADVHGAGVLCGHADPA